MHSGQSGNVLSVYQYKVMELKCLFEFIFGNILFLGDIIKKNIVVRGNELLNLCCKNLCLSCIENIYKGTNKTMPLILYLFVFSIEHKNMLIYQLSYLMNQEE